MGSTDPHLVADPIAFWEQRHVRLDPWRSGGDRGISAQENYELYAHRFGRVIALIRRHAGGDRPLEILDAGCGRGHMTDQLRRCGHRVLGIDSSPTAITRAREAYGPYFRCGDLGSFRCAIRYDVILCMDVLFHVLDDDVWRASLDALARATAAESLILLTDALPDERFVLGDYIVHRARREYEEALAEHDYELVEARPYHFGSNPNSFAAFRRRLT